jgi:hypothetical protein
MEVHIIDLTGTHSVVHGTNSKGVTDISIAPYKVHDDYTTTLRGQVKSKPMGLMETLISDQLKNMEARVNSCKDRILESKLSLAEPEDTSRRYNSTHANFRDRIKQFTDEINGLVPRYNSLVVEYNREFNRNLKQIIIKQ